MGFEGIGEGTKKKTKMVTPLRNMARSVTSLAARWLVHSLAHELAASPEATSRLLSSAKKKMLSQKRRRGGWGRPTTT